MAFEGHLKLQSNIIFIWKRNRLHSLKYYFSSRARWTVKWDMNLMIHEHETVTMRWSRIRRKASRSVEDFKWIALVVHGFVHKIAFRCSTKRTKNIEESFSFELKNIDCDFSIVVYRCVARGVYVCWKRSTVESLVCASHNLFPNLALVVSLLSRPFVPGPGSIKNIIAIENRESILCARTHVNCTHLFNTVLNGVRNIDWATNPFLSPSISTAARFPWQGAHTHTQYFQRELAAQPKKNKKIKKSKTKNGKMHVNN